MLYAHFSASQLLDSPLWWLVNLWSSMHSLQTSITINSIQHKLLISITVFEKTIFSIFEYFCFVFACLNMFVPELSFYSKRNIPNHMKGDGPWKFAISAPLYFVYWKRVGVVCLLAHVLLLLGEIKKFLPSWVSPPELRVCVKYIWYCHTYFGSVSSFTFTIIIISCLGLVSVPDRFMLIAVNPIDLYRSNNAIIFNIFMNCA